MDISDLKLLNTVLSHQKNRLFKKNKKIIIVHNFYKFTTIAEVKSQIKKDIVNNFNVRKLADKFYINDEEDINCSHLVLA